MSGELIIVMMLFLNLLGLLISNYEVKVYIQKALVEELSKQRYLLEELSKQQRYLDDFIREKLESWEERDN